MTACPVCAKDITLTKAGKYRVHADPSTKETCDGAGTVKPVEDVELPGVNPYVEELGKAVEGLAAKQLAAYSETVANTTPFSQPAAQPEQPPLFSQPSGPQRRPVAETQEMTDLGKEITARLKEMFHQYSNRMERNQQQTLGPSEIGSPCDRRLAMSLMRMPPVNPGGDGWASFVGTCTHVGLAEMFMWADAGTGRYAVEVPLTFGSEHVPKGTGDLLDRTLYMFDDHKLMGKWSRNKLKTSGPSQTYRAQVHTYAYGARMKGEKVDHVAIIGWPRDESSLEDLYVWTEPYNPALAKEALERVDRIAAQLGPMKPDGDWSAARPEDFPIADDCRFCPYHMPGARDLSGGACNGKE